MIDISKKFGRNVRNLRMQKGLSQGDMARLLKVHRTYISGIERGIRNPSLNVMYRLAKALKIVVGQLVVGIE